MMEEKGAEKKDDSDDDKAKSTGEAGEEAGRDLVSALSQHASDVLSYNMLGFFESNLDKFAPDAMADEDDEGDGSGESHERHDAYQRYLAELDRQFDDFARTRGFDGPRECFAAVQDALRDDGVRQKKLMEQLERSMDAAASIDVFEDHAEAKDGGCDTKVTDASGGREDREDLKGEKPGDSDEKGGAGDAGDADADSNFANSAGMVLKLMMQPVPLSTLLEATMRITEYRTLKVR